MKNSIQFSKWFMVSPAIVLCLMTCATGSAQSQTNKLRIGVYDSRAVAAAYANSIEFQEMLKGVRADYEKAKAAKDEKRIKEIETRMQVQQRRIHEQAFSTGSVAGIMALPALKEALPRVAKTAGVQAIVSKWELNHHGAEVEVVDVTEQLGILFHASDNGRNWRGALKHAPVPMDEITD